ncbi:hypothetical protein ACT17S_11355 [Glutamicibacter mysorens]
MGADEKHAATYHGGEVTPSTDVVRYYYIDASINVERYTGNVSLEGLRRSAEFDRWLEQVRAEAKAEALRQAAENIHEIDGREDTMARRWLRARANQYKEEP